MNNVPSIKRNMMGGLVMEDGEGKDLIMLRCYVVIYFSRFNLLIPVTINAEPRGQRQLKQNRHTEYQVNERHQKQRIAGLMSKIHKTEKNKEQYYDNAD